MGWLLVLRLIGLRTLLVVWLVAWGLARSAARPGAVGPAFTNSGGGEHEPYLSTVGQAAWAIRQRVPVIVVDLKGDPALAARLEAAATAAGLPFGQFSITPGERRDAWNPLTLGDPATRRDKLTALSEWSEPYYRTVCERFAQRVFSLLDEAGDTPTVGRLIQYLDNPSRLRELAPAIDDRDERRAFDGYLDSVLGDDKQRNALGGFAARLGTLTDPGGPLHRADVDAAGAAPIDLADVLTDGGVVVFSLNAARGQATAAQLAALALLDVQAAAGDRIAAGTSAPAIVAVDEFSALSGDHVLGLLARARAAGIGVILSTQELADLARVDEHFVDQVLAREYSWNQIPR